MVKKNIHFIDLLPEAQINAPTSDYVAVQSITIGRETRPSIFNHPPSAINYSKIRIGKNPVLKFGYGIKQTCWKFIKSKVYFYICLTDEKGKEITLFKTTLKPGSRKKDRFWKDHEIDLSRYSGQTVAITFQTLTKWGHSTAWCWSGWSDPILDHEIEISLFPAPKTKHPLVLIVTGDALRADHLACYGHPIIQTPHIDQLAKDSSLFTHARTQSPCTLGSYASMLTGLFPNKHGINSEWGNLSSKFQSLPRYLRANGFHTIFTASEKELYRSSSGISKLFDEIMPCMAVPAQDGAITTRQAIQRFKKGFSEPTLMWVQYFDTHPPHTPAKAFSSLYYQGDPTHPSRLYQKQMVSEIRGLESVLEIRLSFEMLKQGIIPHGLYERCRSTARVFRGEEEGGADLADHLISLGECAYKNMTRYDFSLWLDHEAESLLHCKMSFDLQQWLLETLEKLKVIESEIISWLDDVVDYRYPVSQYMSAATYFDHQLGILISSLKDQGLYDQTMIIVTSPHGELLGEYGISFHHHLLTEEVLRIPLIIKPAQKVSGKIVGGVFDIIDLFPTIVEALGVKIPLGIDGSSRWKNVLFGEDIPAHDSFANNYSNTASAVLRDHFLFLKAHKDYYMSPEFKLKAGERRLYSLKDSLSYQNNIIDQYPEIAKSMDL